VGLIADIAADFAFFRSRCDDRAVVALQSYGLYPLVVYRYGHAIGFIRWTVLRWPLLFVYHLFRVATELLFGISLARSADIGVPLMIHHHGQIFVAGGCRIGARCQIYQGVTIGESGGRRAGRPTIGDEVIIGAGAKVLGAVTVGSGARVGANAVVISDVAGGTTVVGIPARPVGEAI
jgi:serine O-acetyltransferase